MKLNIMTWNATGIMTGIPYLCETLKNYLRSFRTLLLPRNANILNSLDLNYQAHTVKCGTPSTFNDRQLGKGGVAILWHKSIDTFVEPLDVDCDRVAAVKLSLNGANYVFIQTYLPCTNHTLDVFKATVDVLSDLCQQHDTSSSIIIMGDLNVTLPNTTQHPPQNAR